MTPAEWHPPEVGLSHNYSTAPKYFVCTCGSVKIMLY